MTGENRDFELWDSANKTKVRVSARKAGLQWTAFCPFHSEQKTPNLSINDIKRVYFCFACGAKGHLYEPGFVDKKRPIEEIYDYEDKEGKLIFQAVRFKVTGKDKTLKFKQRRPNGNGGFIWNLEGVNRVIYNLPEISKKPDKPLFIVEGEKDCNNLGKMGILATTGSGGAGKWRTEYNRYFKDREVILLPDNDKVGFKHARDIGRSLKGIAKSIRWLILPGLSEGQDVSDWLERGGDLEKLFELVKSAPNFFSLPEAKEDKGDSKGNGKEGKKERTRTLIPGLIHLVKESETAVYLLQNSGSFYIEETHTLEDGTICRPKQNLPIYHCGIDILEEPRDIDYRELLKEIIDFIKTYLELPKGKEEDYLVLALWVFHTYVIEKFEATPILYFQGVKETGKTRAGEVLGELAYKCERMTSPTEATLFRSADYFKTSLVIDEIQLWGKNGNEEVARLIKSRYKRGLKVSRVNLNRKGEDQIEYFDVFAPLVISTTEAIPDIIESRCISFLMQKNKNPEVEMSIDKELARKIRNKLTVFRANSVEWKPGEFDPVSRRRLNEILMPLYQVLMEVAPDLENEFKVKVIELEQVKDVEEEFTIEAEVVEAIVEYYNETGETSFLTSEITERLNRERTERDKFPSRVLGRRIVSLGFQKKRLINGKRGYCFELNFLKGLVAQYKVKKIELEGNLFNG